MVNIELVIKIPEENYERIKFMEETGALNSPYLQAIAYSTPLTDILDKIGAEFINKYPKNYMGELELDGSSCVFSLNKVLKIIDKYKTESETSNADNN